MLIIIGYFYNEKNAQNYIKMINGYDGIELINKLQNFLKKDSTLLEIGMGPGKDLDILKKNLQSNRFRQLTSLY